MTLTTQKSERVYRRIRKGRGGPWLVWTRVWESEFEKKEITSWGLDQRFEKGGTVGTKRSLLKIASLL